MDDVLIEQLEQLEPIERIEFWAFGKTSPPYAALAKMKRRSGGEKPPVRVRLGN
jgi:hypothetical protein